MNLFTGMSRNEIISAVLAFLLFNGFVIIEVIALAAFYSTSRPRAGRVRSAAIWHLIASVFAMLAIITTVWAAPAQKSFLDDDTVSDLFPFNGLGHLDWRFTKVIIGAVFAGIAILCIAIGVVQGRAQKRRWQDEALLA
jgi:hypothetical protein